MLTVMPIYSGTRVTNTNHWSGCDCNECQKEDWMREQVGKETRGVVRRKHLMLEHCRNGIWLLQALENLLGPSAYWEK